MSTYLKSDKPVFTHNCDDEYKGSITIYNKRYDVYKRTTPDGVAWLARYGSDKPQFWFCEDKELRQTDTRYAPMLMRTMQKIACEEAEKQSEQVEGTD